MWIYFWLNYHTFYVVQIHISKTIKGAERFAYDYLGVCSRNLQSIACVQANLLKARGVEFII